MIKNIFFDFDGVLLDSVNVKTEAFRKLYEFAGKDIADKVVQYHLDNGGVSRFEKIKYFHQNFLGISLNENEINDWANKFSDLALDGVVNATEIAGASNFLNTFSGNYKCWVITGTPTVEMRDILLRKKWNHFFIEAYGSPEKKHFWTEHLISTHQLIREETIFIGDALADYNAAEFSKLHFLLRRSEDNVNLFNNYEGLSSDNLLNLEQIISEIK